MNNKIRELAEQSGFFPVPDSTEWDWEFRAENARYERFAELIIKECASICDRLEGEYLEKSKDEYECYSDLKADGAAWCSTEILNYFGTEL